MAKYNLHVVRKLNLAEVEDDTIAFLVEKEGFDVRHPWVNNDKARDVEITDSLVGAAAGFGVADDSGRILAEFDTLAEADFARDHATIEFNVSFSANKKQLATVSIDG